MGFRELIFFACLVLKGCCALSQCVQAPGACSCVSSSPIRPAGQFVIPAVIKPILQSEPVISAPAPVSAVVDAPIIGGLPPPIGAPSLFGGMPPIIVDEDEGSSFSMLYWLLLALNRRNGGFGGCGNNCGGCGNCGGYGGCGSCGGNGGCGGCGNCGGYGGYSGCGSCGGYSSCGGCGNCGGCNNGCNGGCGGNCGYNFGCGGNGCNYIPYPFPYSCGSCGSTSSTCSCSTTDNSSSCSTPEINLIIKTSDDSGSGSSNKTSST